MEKILLIVLMTLNDDEIVKVVSKFKNKNHVVMTTLIC